MSSPKKIVIAGGGIAGLSAAQGAREISRFRSSSFVLKKD